MDIFFVGRNTNFYHFVIRSSIMQYFVVPKKIL